MRATLALGSEKRTGLPIAGMSTAATTLEHAPVEQPPNHPVHFGGCVRGRGTTLRGLHFFRIGKAADNGGSRRFARSCGPVTLLLRWRGVADQHHDVPAIAVMSESLTEFPADLLAFIFA